MTLVVPECELGHSCFELWFPACFMKPTMLNNLKFSMQIFNPFHLCPFHQTALQIYFTPFCMTFIFLSRFISNRSRVSRYDYNYFHLWIHHISIWMLRYRNVPVFICCQCFFSPFYNSNLIYRKFIICISHSFNSFFNWLNTSYWKEENFIYPIIISLKSLFFLFLFLVVKICISLNMEGTNFRNFATKIDILVSDLGMKPEILWGRHIFQRHRPGWYF